jgi:hypothetical protein
MERELEIEELPVTLTYLLLAPLVVILLLAHILELERLVAGFV